MSTPQYAFRAQKSSGIVEGPSWEVTSKVPPETPAVRCYAYSTDGDWFACATASEVQLLPSLSSSSTPAKLIPQANVIALSFSPMSTILFTFERPIKSETEVYKNVKAWDVKAGEEVGGWYQKTQDDWEPIITRDESHLLRATVSDILVFAPPLSSRPSTRLKCDGIIRGLFISNPTAAPAGSTPSQSSAAYSEAAVAIWFGERKGAPAALALYTLSSLVGEGGDPEKTEHRHLPMTTARKAFYQADKLSVKWNAAGTMALFLTHTDVDNTGKSYYGETNLYLVSLDGSFDGIVELDKEGPIYDFCWSPTSREFVVCYDMPARTQLYDLKTKPVHSFGSQHRNSILYQPQGRLLLSAGFGNLAGGVDIWDVSTRNKVAEFKASNSSHCEWSPCGQYILTATLSPRLRVDNAVKLWWCGGQLLHIHPQDELYQVSFRPQKPEYIEAFPAVLPPPLEANQSVALHQPKGEAANAGGNSAEAYRPPGARGTIASDAYKRDENGEPISGTSTATPMFKGSKPAQRYVPGRVPGAPLPGAAEDKKKKGRNKRSNRENGEANGVVRGEDGELNGNGDGDGAAALVEGMTALVTKEEDEAVQKKLRGLFRKVEAIEKLKEKMAKGEPLEKTQIMKIETETQLKAEIKGLGASL